MKKENFEEAKELDWLINKTQNAIEKLELIKINKERSNKIYDDGLYNFYISTSFGRDEIDLSNRNYGNKRLLDIILVELILQLKEFEEKFESL